MNSFIPSFDDDLSNLLTISNCSNERAIQRKKNGIEIGFDCYLHQRKEDGCEFFRNQIDFDPIRKCFGSNSDIDNASREKRRRPNCNNNYNSKWKKKVHQNKKRRTL